MKRWRFWNRWRWLIWWQKWCWSHLWRWQRRKWRWIWRWRWRWWLYCQFWRRCWWHWLTWKWRWRWENDKVNKTMKTMTMRMMMDDGWRGRRLRHNNDEDDAGEPADPPAGDYLPAAERHLSQQPLRTATQGAPPIDISTVSNSYYINICVNGMFYCVLSFVWYIYYSIYQFFKAVQVLKRKGSSTLFLEFN